MFQTNNHSESEVNREFLAHRPLLKSNGCTRLSDTLLLLHR